MYPFGRITYHNFKARRKAKEGKKLGFFDKIEITTRIYPWDLDFFFELNNGRALTLYDIPRVSLIIGNGMWQYLKDEKVGMTVAGSSVTYRKRATVFQKLHISAQVVGVDEKFFYVLQNMRTDQDFFGQVIVRKAFVKNGIFPPLEAIKMIDPDANAPKLPEWVQNWAAAEKTRPWPPENI